MNQKSQNIFSCQDATLYIYPLITNRTGGKFTNCRYVQF